MTNWAAMKHRTMKSNNETIYLESLIDLGMRPQEAKVYLACLKLGQSTVGKIAEESGVQRTFVYDILKDLQEKGIVSWVERRGKQNYSAVPIETFRQIQENKFKRFIGLIPEIKALENTVGDRPKVRFFEGAEGIKIALQDTLEMPRGSEILAYATARGFWEDEKKFAAEYIRKRVHEGINYRSIMPDMPELGEYVRQDEKHKRITRLVPPEKFGFTNEINIYGNKMLIMSLQGELLAVIIESESVAKTQRMIFELAWEGANQFASGNLQFTNSTQLSDKDKKNRNKSTGYLEARVGQYGLIRNSGGKILVLERSRSKTWCLPGGRLNEDEKEQKKALYRELKEETRLDCEIGKLVDAAIISDQYQTKACTYFEAFPKDLNSLTISSEHSRYAWIGREEIENYNFEYKEVKEVVRKFLNS